MLTKSSTTRLKSSIGRFGLTSIGVDMKTDHMLANVVDGYRKADNPGELVAAVSQILAETGGTGTDVGGEDAFEYIAPLSHGNCC